MIPYPSIRSLLDSQVRRYGDRTFLIHYGENGRRIQLSFRQFLARVSQGANFLREKDISYGDRIAVRARNDPDTVVKFFSTWVMGAVAVPLRGERGGERDFVLHHSRASRLLLEYDEPFAELLREEPDEFKIGKKSKLDDVVVVIYKSHGFGHGRGVVLTHYNVLVDAMAVGQWHEWTDEDVLLCGLPLADVTGIVGGVLSGLYWGCSVVLLGEESLKHVLKWITRERACVALVGDQTLTDLTSGDRDTHQYDLSHLRYFITPHCNLSSELILQVRNSIGVRVIPGFALADASSFSSFLPIDLPDDEYLKRMDDEGRLPVGAALHPEEMGILDAHGQELPEGERGQIVLRGHSVMKGYLENEAATQEAFKHGWLHTGEE
ncbi:MAG: class I adenylate-forming enzyme family protein, partial [Fidelibacterota bacterium]